MNLKIHIVTLFVDDYDKAIRFFIDKLSFVLIEDILMTTTRRWVKVAPDIQSPVHILLHVPIVEEDKKMIGNQAGTRPLIVLNAFDLRKDVETLELRGIHFTKPITEEIYGIRAQFKDLYGNLWELIQYDVFS